MALSTVYAMLHRHGWRKLAPDKRHPQSAHHPAGQSSVVFLPPYAPELNPVEHLWDDLREKSFQNRVFDSVESLDDHLELALKNFEQSPNRAHGITGWPWIICALSN
ncbi:MAG TPA: transposase [Thiobacillus sp.]|nr:transposase [Thiobacillus sp.]HQT71359.1 transposase [Thiobacillus sp.]